MCNKVLGEIMKIEDFCKYCTRPLDCVICNLNIIPIKNLKTQSCSKKAIPRYMMSYAKEKLKP